MKPVLIGKGMYRLTVRSKQKRERLKKMPDVQVDGLRVIFPEWLIPHIQKIIEPVSRPKLKSHDQTNLFE